VSEQNKYIYNYESKDYSDAITRKLHESYTTSPPPKLESLYDYSVVCTYGMWGTDANRRRHIHPLIAREACEIFVEIRDFPIFILLSDVICIYVCAVHSFIKSSLVANCLMWVSAENASNCFCSSSSFVVDV